MTDKLQYAKEVKNLPVTFVNITFIGFTLNISRAINQICN